MLRVHRGERTSTLARALGRVLSDPLGDPFLAEIVAVPTRGVERWLTQQLSLQLGVLAGADGICANVRFPSPGQLISDVLAAASGYDPREDPWRPESLLWPILQLLAELERPPGDLPSWGPALCAHLWPDGPASPPAPGRRLVLAGRLARLFARYEQSRPDMVRSWAAGEDSDGRGPVPPDLTWQPELWRALRHTLGVPSPAERLPEVRLVLQELGPMDQLAPRGRPTVTGRHTGQEVLLPPRLSVFGATSLPRVQLEVLSDLARGREVHLWLPHPSASLWEAIGRVDPVIRRADDLTDDLVNHPLLASLGRDVREFQQRLLVLNPTVTHHDSDSESGKDEGSHRGEDSDSPSGIGGAGTLLQRVQASLRDDSDLLRSSPDGGALPVLDPADRSIQVHACHGAARQVEVLREVLVGLLADDPTLEPRDVLVMCPDVEVFAPLIAATFGLVDDEREDVHPGHRLRVRLADRSLRQTNPVLTLLASLLDLAAGRATASEVLDVMTQAPVRRRFLLSDDDVERVTGWVLAAPVHWGFDEADRARAGIPDVAQGTWRAGLDRVLLGAAMSDNLRGIGTVLPYDDVDSTDLELVGRVGELLDRLQHLVSLMREPHPVAAWTRLLGQALDALAAVGPRDDWQRLQADSELAELAESATLSAPSGDPGAGEGSPVLDLDEVRVLLDERWAGRATRANFRTGSLTVSSLLPMRSVPHRVICLLGMDDGAFPRLSQVDGDDVLARDPWLGERDSRTEDRQLLLDALMDTEETLVIVHTGADPRTGARIAPAVPVGELLDTVDALVVSATGAGAREQVIVRHPLQPFDPRYFRPGELAVGRAFSFDRPTLQAASRVRQPRSDVSPYRGAPLPDLPEEEGEVSIEALAGFLASPAKAFLVQRLGVSLPWEQAVVSDRLVIAPDALAQWQVGDRLLQQALEGVPWPEALRAELLRGGLPPRRLGLHYADTVLKPEIDPLLTAVQPYLTYQGAAGPASTAEVLDVEVTLDDGTAISGAVRGVRGNVLLQVSYSRLKPKQRLSAWVRLLVLTLARPDMRWRAVTLGRGAALDGQRGQPRPRLSEIEGVEAEEAQRVLQQLVRLRAEGLRAPLPFAPRASLAYADQRLRDDPGSVPQAEGDARKVWEPDKSQDRGHEGGERENALVWGAPATIAALLEQPAQRSTLERSRFGELALEVWEPLRRHETETRI